MLLHPEFLCETHATGRKNSTPVGCQTCQKNVSQARRLAEQVFFDGARADRRRTVLALIGYLRLTLPFVPDYAPLLPLLEAFGERPFNSRKGGLPAPLAALTPDLPSGTPTARRHAHVAFHRTCHVFSHHGRLRVATREARAALLGHRQTAAAPPPGWRVDWGAKAHRHRWTALASVDQDLLDVIRDLAGPVQQLPLSLCRFPAGPTCQCVKIKAWHDGLVVTMAAKIYRENAFEDLPILADALEEAGAAHPILLAHLRAHGPHARGCWALELILGLS